MLDYKVDKTLLRALVDEQVSQVADEAYSDAGVSLYDSIVLTGKDEEMVGSFLDDAVRVFTTRMYDGCHLTKDSGDNDVIEMYLPDFDVTFKDAAFNEITRFIVFSATTSVFQSRRAQEVEKFSLRAQAALERAINFLKSRKSPTDIW